jgi:hypothetical protein
MILSVASFKYSSRASLIYKKFRPESAVDKRSWSTHDDPCVALAPVAIGFKTIAAPQRGEQAPAPLIGERELRFLAAVPFAPQQQELSALYRSQPPLRGVLRWL